MDPARLRQAFWRARWGIAATVLLSVVVAIPAAKKLAPHDYLARASFLWERPPSTEDPAGDARALRTMIDSVELPTNLAEVRRRLKIPRTLPEIGASVRVTTEPSSNLVLVTAQDTEPRRAAAVANTLVEVFLARQRAHEQTRREGDVENLGADLARARAELQEARRRYDAFRTEHGVTDLSLDTQRAIESAANLRAAAELARADASAEETRARSLRDQAHRLPRTTVRETVTEASTVSPEQRRLEQARLELAEARSRLGPDHPDLQALEARVEAVQAEVARAGAATGTRQSNRVLAPSAQWEALQGTMADAEAQRQVALERSKNLQQLETAARERLQQLSGIEGEASALLAAKRVAEAHVLELADLQARAVDEARAPGTGLRFIARARPPDAPESRARQRAIMIAVPVLALLMVVALVLARSLRGLKVCTATELAYWGGGPVVGSSTWPREPEALLVLVEEFDDMYPQAAGVTLVVGATPAEEEAAHAVAAVMSETQVSPIVAADEREESGKPIAQPESRTALARVGKDTGLAVGSRGGPADRQITAWDGERAGPALRRAARLADRVLVVVRSGTLSPVQAAGIRTRLGRDGDGVGFVVVGIDPQHDELPDRAGPVESFWKGRRA